MNGLITRIEKNSRKFLSYQFQSDAPDQREQQAVQSSKAGFVPC